MMIKYIDVIRNDISVETKNKPHMCEIKSFHHFLSIFQNNGLAEYVVWINLILTCRSFLIHMTHTTVFFILFYFSVYGHQSLSKWQKLVVQYLCIIPKSNIVCSQVNQINAYTDKRVIAKGFVIGDDIFRNDHQNCPTNYHKWFHPFIFG